MRENAEIKEYRSGVREWVLANLPSEVHEPNAGSDLASLQMRAEADGEDFIVSG